MDFWTRKPILKKNPTHLKKEKVMITTFSPPVSPLFLFSPIYPKDWFFSPKSIIHTTSIYILYPSLGKSLVLKTSYSPIQDPSLVVSL